jgi:hypothetical protein
MKVFPNGEKGVYHKEKYVSPGKNREFDPQSKGGIEFTQIGVISGQLDYCITDTGNLKFEGG